MKNAFLLKCAFCHYTLSLSYLILFILNFRSCMLSFLLSFCFHLSRISLIINLSLSLHLRCASYKHYIFGFGCSIWQFLYFMWKFSSFTFSATVDILDFIFNIYFKFSSFSFFLAYSHYYLFLPFSLSIWKCYWAFPIKSIFLGTSLVAQWKFPITPLLFNLLFEVLDSIIKQNKEIQI